MLVIAFFQWWYGPGWLDAGRRVLTRTRHVYLDFSVPILLRTLFAPWRRITAPPGGAIGQQLRAVVDNTVSRFVGLTVRLMALLLAFIMIAATLAIGGLFVAVWPVVPILGLVLIVGGLTI